MHETAHTRGRGPSLRLRAGLSLTDAVTLLEAVMDRSRIVTFAALALIGGSAACNAGPCTSQIAQLEQRIHRAQTTSPPGGAGDPSAPQSVGAQLHHQPTPGSVARAEHRAISDGDAAIERARKADAAGDAAACTKALTEAKDIYGVP